MINLLKRKLQKAKNKLNNIEDDNYQEKDWIIYGDIFIQVLEGDNGYSVSWQRYAPNHYPVRDMLVLKERSDG